MSLAWHKNGPQIIEQQLYALQAGLYTLMTLTSSFRQYHEELHTVLTPSRKIKGAWEGITKLSGEKAFQEDIVSARTEVKSHQADQHANRRCRDLVFFTLIPRTKVGIDRGRRAESLSKINFILTLVSLLSRSTNGQRRTAKV